MTTEERLTELENRIEEMQTQLNQYDSDSGVMMLYMFASGFILLIVSCIVAYTNFGFIGIGGLVLLLIGARFYMGRVN